VDRARRRVDAQRPLAGEAERRGVLVDPHAELQGDAAQSPGQQRRLDRRRVRVEHAREVARRARAAGHLVGRQALEGIDAVRLARAQDAVPGAGVGGRRRRPEEAAAAELRRDPVLGAERLDRVDRRGGLAAQPHGLLGPAALDQARQLRPPGQHHAAVAP
jgi:hypothetical protein